MRLLFTVLDVPHAHKAYRDPDDDHLIAIIQPDESGLDASPKYDVLMNLHQVADEQMRAELVKNMNRLFTAYEAHREDPARVLALDVFNWEDVMVNTIYADGLQCLGGLCRAATGAADDGDGAEPPVAGGAQGRDGIAADGCGGDARLFRAAQAVARPAAL